MKQISICFVAPTAYPLLALDRTIGFAGGAEVQQSLIATEMARRGHKVAMICFDHGQGDGEMVRGVRVYKAYKKESGVPVLRFAYPRLTGLWSAMSRANADIYYQRTCTMEVGLVAAYARLNGKVSVFSAANDIDFEPDTNALRHQRDRLLYRWGVRHVDKIVVQTSRQAGLCDSVFGRSSTIIQSGYAYTGKPATQAGDIIWVATAKSIKRPHLFLEVARRLPGYRFRLIGGAGSGEQEQRYYREVCELARGLPNVQNVGFVPYAEVESQFDEASIFVNTSVAEGFPNTFLQAWSRGVPTVSFFDPEIVYREGPVGLIAQDVAGMCSEIEALKSDTGRWSDHSSRSRRYATENHSIESVVDMYEAFLNRPSGAK